MVSKATDATPSGGNKGSQSKALRRSSAGKPNRAEAKKASAGKQSAKQPRRTQSRAASAGQSSSRRDRSGDKSLIARVEQAVPDAVEKVGNTASEAAKRAGRAAATGAEKLSGTGKYLAAGALAGAVIGAAFEASRKRSDGDNSQRQDGSDHNSLWGLASRALESLGEYAGHYGRMAAEAAGSLVKSDPDESPGGAHTQKERGGAQSSEGEGRGSAVPGQENSVEGSYENKGRSDGQGNRSQFASDDGRNPGSQQSGQSESDEESSVHSVIEYEIRSGVWRDEEPEDQDAPEELSSEGSDEQPMIANRAKGRRRSTEPEFERNWEA